jgi:hypothetical protein
VCDQFVHNIAGKTLRRIKQLSERGVEGDQVPLAIRLQAGAR